MKAIAISFVTAVVLSLAAAGCGGEENAGSTTVPVPEEFVGPERAVVKELFTIFERPGFVGSLEQAAERADVALTDSLRRSILAKMEAKMMMHDLIARYRPYTFVMTNDEKRIAAYIRHYEQKNQEFPSLDTVAAEVNMDPLEVKERLEFLSSVGMFYDLGGPDEYNDLGFSYGQKLGDFLFDLGTHLHVMKIGQSSEINVGCGKEALFVVASEYPDAELTYTTYDPVTLEEITIEFRNGEIVSTAPESAVLFEGGTCGTNNFFATRANAEEWAAHEPQWQGQQLPIYSAGDRLETVKQELDEQVD